MSWKYVIVAAGNREWPIIFPDTMVHRLVAESVKDYFVRVAAESANGLLTPKSALALREQIRIVSAGSINFDTGTCSGHSETLGVAAREHDAAFIRSYRYHGGIVDDPRAD